MHGIIRGFICVFTQCVKHPDDPDQYRTRTGYDVTQVHRIGPLLFARSLLKAPLVVDSGYPHNSPADKNPCPHDCHGGKDSYPHNSNIQCLILKLQLAFVQLMLA